MTRKTAKNLFLLSVLLVTIIAQAVKWRHYQLSATVVFLDVGQGDAALLLIKGKVVVIDGGPDNSLLHKIGDQLPYFERRIDYLIISHDHDDHIVGLVELINRYQVSNIIYGPTISGSLTAEYLRAQAMIKNVNHYQVIGTATIPLSAGYFLELLNPDSLGVKEDENNSLIALLSGQEKEVLFMGDNNSQVEAAVIASGRDRDISILKAGHHGSKTSSSRDFLIATSPNYFIVSAGVENRFGHPHLEVLQRAVAIGAEIKRTTENGSIEFELFTP